MNYQNGKIYTIRSHQTDKIYIGSTCSPLHKRFYQHKNCYKLYQQGKFCFLSSYEIVKYEDCYIELLEDYKCENKNQLMKREGELIRVHKSNCVNIKVENRTDKEYRDDNKEKINARHRQYNLKYFEQNKEKELIRIKKYQAMNKDKIREYGKQKIVCICGSIKIGRAHV